MIRIRLIVAAIDKYTALELAYYTLTTVTVLSTQGIRGNIVWLQDSILTYLRDEGNVKHVCALRLCTFVKKESIGVPNSLIVLAYKATAINTIQSSAVAAKILWHRCNLGH